MSSYPGDWWVGLALACWVAILLGLTVLWVKRVVVTEQKITRWLCGPAQRAIQQQRGEFNVCNRKAQVVNQVGKITNGTCFAEGAAGGKWIGRDKRFAHLGIEASLIYLAILPMMDENRLIPESPDRIASNALSFVYDKHEAIPGAVQEWLAAGVAERREGGMIYLVEIEEQEADDD